MLFASDLDRTLIYSRRSMGPDADPEMLTAVEEINGKLTAFMTTAGLALHRQMSSKISFVPVTTRTAEQYKRVTGLLDEVQEPEYAIVANGAVILKNGVPMAEWSARIQKQLLEDRATVKHVLKQLEVYTGKEFILEVKQAEEWFIYMIIDEQKFSPAELEHLAKIFFRQGFTFSQQGRKLYIMPNCINKATALNFVIKQLQAETVLAAGDSLLDLEMVKAADHGFIPAHGEAAQDAEVPASVRITAASGIQAGEEILQNVRRFLL
ncbi:hypothetical protein B0X71_04415 [Planococcus lenghuensis]|uniref:Sucrose phosphatase-like domain-containing protein n=1 Tax=Planococcus lenghuensis TaxID=2213202 RepID=A0A1Q2L4J8_9BACL|nr:hypothetical protein B0X71_04415 [Planococcus lenghuensis]